MKQPVIADVETTEPGLRRISSPIEVGEFLGISINTLAAWRCAGVGPRFMKIGRRIKYRASDVEAWMERRSGQSTTELSAAGAN